MGYNILPEGNTADSTTCVPIVLSRATDSLFSIELTFSSGPPWKEPGISVTYIAARLPLWQIDLRIQVIHISGPFPLDNTELVDMPGFLDLSQDKVGHALDWISKQASDAETELHLWWAFESRVKQENWVNIPDTVWQLANKSKLMRIIIHKQVMSDMEMVQHYFMDMYHHIMVAFYYYLFIHNNLFSRCYQILMPMIKIRVINYLIHRIFRYIYIHTYIHINNGYKQC